MFPKEKSIEKINFLISSVEELKRMERGGAKFKKWIRDTQVALEHIFGKESRHITDFNRISYGFRSYSSSTPSYKFQERYVDGLENAKQVLASMTEEIQEYWQDQIDDGSINSNEQPDFLNGALNTKKIFLIHGHDAGTKEMVARFISKIGLHPIILHEQANQGRTIIEKFEDHSDVGYAIALLTPDDTGSSIKEPDNVQQRARQNVIFEFGYFIGKLGRNRVAGMIRGGIDVPSDYSGVLFIPIDESDVWRLRLFKELKAIGYNIDANKAL